VAADLADGIIVCSAFSREELGRHLGLRGDGVEVIRWASMPASGRRPTPRTRR
jgi:hypothetical protein